MKKIDTLYKYLATTRRFDGSHDVHTPRALVEEILDHIDLVDRSILVLFNVEFVVSLVYNSHIDPARIVFYSDHENKSLLVSRIGVKYITTLDTDMKFDVVVGNPPYQDSTNDSSYTNLWSKIYKNSFQLLTVAGQMAMITPRTWATPKQEGRESQTTEVQNLIANHAIYINIDECARHFPKVGSTFTYYIISKKSTKGQSVRIRTLTSDLVIDNLPTIINCLPKNISEYSVEIFRKILSVPMFKKEKGTTPSGNMIHDRNRTDINKEQYQYRVQYSAGTVKWSDTLNKLQYNKKVLFPNQTTRNYPIYDTGTSSPPNRGAVFLVNSDEEGYNFVNFVKSKIMQFIIGEQRFHHGVLNTNVISNIPKVDLTRTWTDEELYAHFNLTAEEIAYIESSVK